MQLRVTVCALVLWLGLAAASPLARKIEKKSISEAYAAKSIEPVSQSLDEPAKISDQALLEVAGENVDRAKKQASTTFCVEIRQNKPTQVDCDELNNNRGSPPAPATAPPAAPVAPIPSSESSSASAVPNAPSHLPPQQQQQPSEINIEMPCEPEIATYVMQPTGEVLIAPTGNCAQSSGSGYLPLNHIGLLPNSGIQSPNGGAGVHILHVPGGLPSAGSSIVHVDSSTGVRPLNFHHFLPNTAVNPLNIHFSSPTGGNSLNTHGSPTGGSGSPPSVVHLIHPGSNPLIHGLHHHGLSTLNPHALHQLTGIECTCKSTSPLGSSHRTANGAASTNEALALKFLQDIHRNANAAQTPSSPITEDKPSPILIPGSSIPQASLQPGSPLSPSVTVRQIPSLTVMSGDGQTQSLSPAPGAARYMTVRPLARLQQPSMFSQFSPNTSGVIPTIKSVYQVNPVQSGLVRSSNNYDDTFHTGHLVQGLRFSRGPDDADAKAQEQEQTAMKDEKEGKESARIARYLLKDDSPDNALNEA